MSICAVRVFCCLLLSLPAVILAEKPGEAVLPGDGFEPGWAKEGQVRTFYKNDLYGHIDGGAELFLEFGFDNLRVQKYKKGDDDIDLEIYLMTEPAAALGIYLMKCGKETPLKDISARNTANAYQITLVKNNFFIQVNSFSGDEALLPVMSRLAIESIKNTPEAKPVALFDLLPRKDIISGSQLLLRGQYALQPLYTFGAGDIFQMKGKIFGVAADYHIDSADSYSMIIIPYPDSKTGEAAFENVRENLDPYLEITDKLKNRFVFKDYNNRFGDIEIKGNILSVSYNLPDNPDTE
jgi:hypothetical protein